MITLLNTGIATLGVVRDIPQDAKYFMIDNAQSMLFHSCIDRLGNERLLEEMDFLQKVDAPRGITLVGVSLPPGKWEKLGFSDEITSEQAAEICKGKIDHFTDRNGNDISYLRWMNYNTGYFEFEEENPLDSFNSLLLSNGITNRVYIIKQIQ